MPPVLPDHILSSRTFYYFSFWHVPPIEWFGRNITEGRTSSVLMMLQRYLPITTYIFISIVHQPVNGWNQIRNRESYLYEGEWRAWHMCRENTFQRIHKERTVSFALREAYIILVNSTHRLELWDFSPTLSFNHYQCLQFLVARKLLPILVDDHKIIGKCRLEGTLGGL